ncbi:MAG: DNA polymerase III subunit gamma/tau [Lachnospiraceae bacterium]|nr:DNA polymerase III subunit gamma/tau [Lachnospiraceae bacterium]
MSYMALYRKWRPDDFSEVKGQDHIVTTLTNQLKHDRVGHAYMFCGTRGTGKTTVAKIFAKAVNCENPLEDGSPCNECAVCKAIANGSSMNVMEIDAASNNGVDSIRELREDVQYPPTEGKYKVYIIDEAHMITNQAFNAFLKTIEEPPEYCIFIFATTDYQKVPITIMSRCQRYNFRRISLDTITDRLKELMEREGLPYEEAALRYVAKVGDGSMRDALSVLEQCISYNLGELLTYDTVLSILGAVDIEIYDRLLSCVTDGDILGAVDIIDEVMWSGSELTQFLGDFIWYLRNLLLVIGNEKGIEKVDLSTENKKLLLNRSKSVKLESLTRYIRILSETESKMRYATQKRVELELAIIRLATPQMETDITSVLDRVRVLEEKLEKGVVVKEQATDDKVSEVSETSGKTKESTENVDIEAELKKHLKPADAENIGSVLEAMPKIKAKLPGALKEAIGEARFNVSSDGQKILLCFDEREGKYRAHFFKDEENLSILSQTAGEVTGVSVDFALAGSNEVKGVVSRPFDVNSYLGIKGVNVEIEE